MITYSNLVNKTANGLQLTYKNWSLNIGPNVITATDQIKLKIIKDDITQHHTDIQVISIFTLFAVFDLLPLTLGVCLNFSLLYYSRPRPINATTNVTMLYFMHIQNETKTVYKIKSKLLLYLNLCCWLISSSNWEIWKNISQDIFIFTSWTDVTNSCKFLQ